MSHASEANTTHDPQPVKLRLTPTEARRRENRLARYAAKLACKWLRLGREAKEAQS